MKLGKSFNIAKMERTLKISVKALLRKNLSLYNSEEDEFLMLGGCASLILQNSILCHC